MFQLVYASTATRPMQPRELEAMLTEAREKNEDLDVTGMLLYCDGRFLQVLEGREHTVRDLYDTIRGDDRHTTVITLRERLVAEREFADWTMGFRNLDETEAGVLPDGYVPLTNGHFTTSRFRQDPGQAHQALLQFRNTALP